jgi:hypothetical protein
MSQPCPPPPPVHAPQPYGSTTQPLLHWAPPYPARPKLVPPKKKRKKWPWSVAAIAALLVIVINTSAGPRAPATVLGEHVPASVKAAPADTVDLAPGAPAAPIAYEGEGDEVLNLEKPVGVAVLDFECPQCSGNTVLKTDGREALLVNGIGSYAGRHLIDVSDTARTSMLTITAKGSWKVTVTPGLSAVRITDGARISGTGDDVVAINGATTRALIKNRGESNFAVWIVGEDMTDLAVNEIGSYEGTVALRAPAVAIVTSSGDWSIAPF